MLSRLIYSKSQYGPALQLLQLRGTDGLEFVVWVDGRRPKQTFEYLLNILLERSIATPLSALV